METEKRTKTQRSESFINKKLTKPKKNTGLYLIINQLKCNKGKSTNNWINLTIPFVMKIAVVAALL